MGVAERFKGLLSNLKLTDAQKADGASKRESVIRVLNRNYWGSESGTLNSRYVGSWAKLTRIRPPRDVDVLFELPAAVHTRFENRSGNRQSQLLQEVRTVLGSVFTGTTIKGDGPVVLVSFYSYRVEVIPAFSLQGGGHWVSMTDNNGHYKKADYSAESTMIADSNSTTKGNTRDLVRMMKCWQAYCAVPLKSFHIELLSVDFLKTWGNSGKSEIYYDWMCRDFFEYIVARQNSFVVAPGTSELMFLGAGWVSKAESALSRARRACSLESSNAAAAGDEWQKIFGSDIPKYV